MSQRLTPALVALAVPLAVPARPASPERPPEAVSLLGAPLHPPEIPAERRRVLEDDLARAVLDFVRDPQAADSFIWLGRRLAYLGRYRDAIDVYSQGLARHPDDFRLLRHRGHRYLTVRRLDDAVADLERAARLIRGVPDAVEPDGDPNPRGIPTSTSHFNIWYHLGLAYYLKGDFENARRSYRECLTFSTASPDRLVATSDWLYTTLRRLGRDGEAAQVLEPIRADLAVLENTAYLNRLLLYRGERTEAEVLGAGGDDGVAVATYGYGVANWHRVNGRAERARELLERVVRSPQWAAFGVIAAEADLARDRR
jgi:tetratricopeptide (TPR) repeat protein